jgi:hypothetical protein
MKKVLIAIAFVTILGLPLPVHAADVQGVEIGQYGIYTGDKLGQEDAANAAVGYKSVTANIVFQQKTERITAAVGTSFGFEYVIRGSGEGGVDLTVKYLHPAITNPKTGRVFTSQEIVSDNRVIGKTHLIGYRFDEAWEIVPGTWTIQLLYGDKKLAEKTFQVVKP